MRYGDGANFNSISELGIACDQLRHVLIYQISEYITTEYKKALH
jgi:hypothetical protein